MRLWKSQSKRPEKLSRKKGSKTQLIVVAALLLLLPLLAALQYRWLGQLSKGEREQMKNNLRAVANRFSQDFDLEIARTYAAFLPDRPEREDWNKEKPFDVAARYDRWLASSAYPRLVNSVFLAKLDEQRQFHLTRLNVAARQLEPMEWPENMTGLRQQLEPFANDFRFFSNQSPSMSLPPNEPVRMGFRLHPSFNEEASALILPVFNLPVFKLTKSGEPPRPVSIRPVDEFVILTLNLSYIQQEILPLLVKRHFTEGGELHYDLAVVSQRNPGQTIYQYGQYSSANSGTVWDVSHADISVPLFNVRFDAIRNLMRLRRDPAESVEVVKGGQRAGAMVSGEPPEMPFFGTMGGPPMPEPPRLSRSGQSGQLSQSAQPLQPNEMGGMWQLHIRHHSGSLEAAVTSVRRRNLFISFGILALLGASVALMMLSSRRARRLAEQQMDFVAGISHELRTPLAVIDSAAYNLDKGVIKDPQQIKNYGALIRKETGRLTEMVEQVLEFAGVQSGRQRYDLQPSSITQVIDDVLASSRQLLPLLNEGEFQLETYIAPDLPMVLADAQAIARALHNLLNNAMKYSGQSRWIGLRADAPSEKQVRIVISDRGLGIPQEDLPHIFEPFYRGHEARAAQIHGNGLGLSLVKNIIEAHGGQITVKSKAGEGSSFIIILPAVIEADRRAIIGAELPAAN